MHKLLPHQSVSLAKLVRSPLLAASASSTLHMKKCGSW